MEGLLSGSRPARFLLGATLVCLALALTVTLMPRGGMPEDVAVHFAGPGSFPIVPHQTPEQATAASQK